MFSFFVPPIANWRKRRLAHKVLEDRQTDPAQKIEVDLGQYIARFTKSSLEKNDLPIQNLDVDLFNMKLESGWMLKAYFSRYATHVCFVDAHYHFVLTYTKGEQRFGIATLGFHLNPLWGSILIEQLQAIKNGAAGGESSTIQNIISGLRWEKLLVQIAEDWAKKFGFGVAKIKKAQWNRWYRKCNPYSNRPLSDRRKSLELRYNVTAQRMKYRQRLGSRYFSKALA